MADADTMLCERCWFWTPHDGLPKTLQVARSLGRCANATVALNALGMAGNGRVARTEYTTARFGCRFWKRMASETDARNPDPAHNA
jgi:hypothetical protein